jgi:P27 family predicted phage terminase small subunit
MARGRPSKPLELKRLQGNPGKRSLPAKTATIALPMAVGAPAPITLGHHGRDLWRRALELAPWLSELDLMALEDLASTWDEVQAFRAAIAEDGLTLEEPIVTPAGHLVGTKCVPNPLLKELRNAQNVLHAIGSALDFDPTARSRLGLAEVKRQNKLGTLRNQRGGPN